MTNSKTRAIVFIVTGAVVQIIGIGLNDSGNLAAGTTIRIIGIIIFVAGIGNYLSYRRDKKRNR